MLQRFLAISAVIGVCATAIFSLQGSVLDAAPSLKSLVVLVLVIGFGYLFNETRRQESSKLKTVEGKKVLITGGAQGMGKLYAEKAVKENASAVILWDVNEEGLKATAEELKKAGGKVHIQKVDISSLDAIVKAAAETKSQIGTPDVLINNAGIVRGKRFWEHDNIKDTDLTVKINTLAPMWITREFINDMIASKGEGRIINMASAAGLVSNPKMSVYCASKWGVVGWSDSLRIELEQEKHSHLKVTTVCPGYINTGMFDGVTAPLLTPILTPQLVCDTVWEEGKRGKPIIKMPWTIHLSQFLRGILAPPTFDYIAGEIFGVYKTMNTFQGRPADVKSHAA